MKYIVVGTNRKDSNSKKIALFIQKIYSDLQETVEIIDLPEMNWANLPHGQFGEVSDPTWKSQIDKITKSDGLIMVVPEYNGSVPGALKMFIDYWKYPESFVSRPVCFVGLGGMFGGLRPVEHLQQVFGYRNAYIFPERIFLMNVWKNLVGGELQDQVSVGLLKSQAAGFQKFCRALKVEGLHAVKSESHI